jgi:hypothetical protein
LSRKAVKPRADNRESTVIVSVYSIRITFRLRVVLRLVLYCRTRPILVQKVQVLPCRLRLSHSLVNLVVSFAAAKFKPFIFSVWLRRVQCCGHFHSHDFVSTFCLLNFVLRFYTYDWLKAVCRFRTDMNFAKFSVVRITFFCWSCNFKTWASADYSQADEA